MKALENVGRCRAAVGRLTYRRLAARYTLACALTAGLLCPSARAQQTDAEQYLTRANNGSILVTQKPIESRTVFTATRNELGLEIPLDIVAPNRSAPVVTALAASRDGRYLAAAGDDHIIRLIDANDGRILGDYSGHTDWIQSLVFSSDSKQLYSCGNDGRVLCWDYAEPKRPTEILQLPHAVRSLSLSTHRGLLAVAGFGDEVGVWDLKAQKWHFKFPCSCGDQRCVRFSPDGDKLLGGGRDGYIHVWDTVTGQELAHVALHHDRVHTAAFSVDGKVVTSVSDDRRIVRYDLLSQAVTLDRELKGAKLRSLCLINDYLIAAAGADNTIHIFDVLADEEVGKLTGHTGSVAVMCSSSDHLVSGAFDTTVRVWKLESALQQSKQLTVPVRVAPLEVDRNMDIR